MNKLYAASGLLLIFSIVAVFGSGAIYLANKFEQQLLPDQFTTKNGSICYRIKDKPECIYKDTGTNTFSCYICTRSK